MRLNKREVTKIAEDLNAMEDMLDSLRSERGGLVHPSDSESYERNSGTYLYVQSMLLNMDGDSARRVHDRREELRAERKI